MHILVTGASGFVGGHLVPRLLQEGYSLTCLVRNQEKANILHGKYSVNIFIGDVTDPDTLKGISEGVDYVIHLAAMGHVSAVTKESYNAFVEINEKGTKNLISEFSSGTTLKKFIHFSSTAAMGPIGLPLLNEESPPNPLTPYQKSKQRSEQIVLRAFKEKQFPGLILRPCMIYGPGGYGEFHKFCRLMKRGVFPKVGLGKNLTPLVYVEDVVNATIAAIERGRAGESYIIASENSIPMDNLRQLIVGNIGVKPPYIYVPGWFALAGARLVELLFPLFGKEPIATYRNIKSTIVDRTFDINKAKNELGYIPCYTFEEGIKQTIAWYKSQQRI